MTLHRSHAKNFKRMHFLSQLYLNCCYFKAEDINNIIPHLKHLKKLLIDDAYQQVYDSSIKLLRFHSPSLQHIFLRNTKMSIDLAKALLSFPDITFLNIKGCKNFCPKELYDHILDIHPSIEIRYDYDPQIHAQYEPYHDRICPYIQQRKKFRSDDDDDDDDTDRYF